MAPTPLTISGSTLPCLLVILTAAHTVILVDSSHCDHVPAQSVLEVTIDRTDASGSYQDFPDILRLDIKASDPFPQSLLLYRKDVINTDVPAYVFRRDSEGVIYTERIYTEGEETTAAYHNEEHGAAFIAKCTANDIIHVAGTMYVDGCKYRVRHNHDVTSPGEVTASYYDFAFINDTFHGDGIFQERFIREGTSQTPKGEVTDHKYSGTDRVRRETQDYYIDVVAALDYSTYQYWLARAGNNATEAVKQAKEYVAYIFNGITSRFSSIPGLNVVLTAFIIAKTPGESPWTEEVKEATSSGVYQVKAEDVLAKLKEYVNASYNNNITLPPHDHIMLFTEYDLYGNDNGFRFNNTAGLAYVGTMCQRDGGSVSVVEDHGGFQSETTATHELGHSLGSLHDGTNNDCESEDRYVMAGGVHPVTSANKRNPWFFSNCSASAFQERFQNIDAAGLGSCLTDRVANDSVPAVSGYPGQLAGPDEQCRQIYGSTSYLCRGTRFGAPSDICLSMYCRNPSTLSSCTLQTAAAGTCCGSKMWCIKGECVDAPNSTCYVSSTCPFGQRQGVVYQDLTCDQMQSGNCYNNNFRQVCCEMCDRQRSDVYGCEYGDKVLGCNATYCGMELPGTGDLYDEQCCGTCQHAPTTLTPPTTPASTTIIVDVPDLVDTCRDTALVNGTEQCSVFLARAGLAYCCQEGLRTACCRSCEDRKNVSDPSCPYGDCAICTDLQTRPVPCEDEQRFNCCKTCQDLDLRLSTTTPTNTQPTITASTTASITASTTTTTTTTEKECIEIPGVVVCGVEGLGGGWWVLVLVGVSQVVQALLP